MYFQLLIDEELIETIRISQAFTQDLKLLKVLCQKLII